MYCGNVLQPPCLLPLHWRSDAFRRLRARGEAELGRAVQPILESVYFWLEHETKYAAEIVASRLSAIKRLEAVADGRISTSGDGALYDAVQAIEELMVAIAKNAGLAVASEVAAEDPLELARSACVFFDWFPFEPAKPRAFVRVASIARTRTAS